MGDVAVSVENVSKMFRLYHDRNQSLKAAVLRRGRARYEEFQALDDVSLEVPAGTTFGLIGENGSGKSTLLKCMARILRPDSSGWKPAPSSSNAEILPWVVIEPMLGVRILAMHLSSVLLPEPLCPMRPNDWPSGTSNDTSCNAHNSL